MKPEAGLEILKDAIEGYAEASQYKGDYLREKHGDDEEVAKAFKAHAAIKSLIERQSCALVEAREALEPFARMADEYDDYPLTEDRHSISIVHKTNAPSVKITLGDLRRARTITAALTEKDE